MTAFHFPKDFLWGAATAAHQVEDNNINSELWLLEHLPETIFKEPSGNACDHYHRHPENIALLSIEKLRSVHPSLARISWGMSRATTICLRSN